MAWVSEAIVEFLRGPMYVHPLMGFIDEKCLIFTPEDENKFEYSTVHTQFQELVDSLLTDFLTELGVTPEEFFKIATDSKDQLTGFVVQTILTVDDFMMFKAMMVKRNMDLTNQVLNAVDELRSAVEGAQSGPASPVFAGMASPQGDKPKAAAEVDPADLDKAVKQSKTDYEAQARMQTLQNLMRSLQLQDEDVALAIAIANSLRDSARSQSERAEMEQAIALSLALEAEQRRMDAAGGDGTKNNGIPSLSAAGKAKGAAGAGTAAQEFLSGAFPEPKPMPMAPLPNIANFSQSSLPSVAPTPLDPLNIGPNTAADKMAQVAAAAARAASLLSTAGVGATPAPVQGGESSRQCNEVRATSKFTPQPIAVSDKLPPLPAPAQSSGRFVPAPLNLPDKPSRPQAEVPGVDELMAERSSVGKQASLRNRAAGFKSSGAGGMDMAAVREAASAAAATQKNMIAAERAAGQDGDDAANAWLQDAKKQLVAKKNAEREAEMAAYQQAQKATKKGGARSAPDAGGSGGEDLEAKRADLRDKLAQKFKQDLMSKAT